MNFRKKILSIIAISALVISIFAPLATVKAAQSPLFSVTIIAPGNANLLRRQWAQVFANSLDQLGIDARVVYLPSQSMYDRVLTPAPADVGKTFDQGGYDILAIGWTPGLIPDPRPLFYGGSGFFAPSGQNYYLWNNSESNTLLDEFVTSTSSTDQANAMKQWQELYHNEVPASQIMYQAAPAIVSPHIGNLYTPVTGAGDGWLYFNAYPYPQLLTRDDGKTSVDYCTTGSIVSLNPPESNWWYDVVSWAPMFEGLIDTWPTLNATAHDLDVPGLLTSWSPSADGFTWTFNCRQGVTWQDGAPFTADDVVYSLWALMNPDTGSQFAGYFQSVFGDNVKFTYSDGTSVSFGNGTKMGVVTATDKYTITATLPVVANGKPYGYFDPEVLGAWYIIPKHIFENIAPADWSTSCFNTGQGSTTINGVTYTGPVGTGPYKWVSYDPVAQVVHLQKFDNYWNATALEASGLFKIKDYYVTYIADKTSALAALKSGSVDMLDYNYQMQTDVPSVSPSWGVVLNLQGTGRQEFGYNMQSPIFGTGVDTPLGKSDPSRAAEAAKDIRVAFDYAIPRQLIINNLLSGYGLPGITEMLPTQPFYDSSLSARPYDLAKAAASLEAAGYTVPGAQQGLASTIQLGGAVSINGIYADSSGTPKPNTVVKLVETTDNSTYDTSSNTVGETTTDLNGFYGFVAAPGTIGTHYYYLLDVNALAGSNYKYLGTVTVTAVQTVDLNLLYILAAVAIILSLIAIALALIKRK